MRATAAVNGSNLRATAAVKLDGLAFEVNGLVVGPRPNLNLVHTGSRCVNCRLDAGKVARAVWVDVNCPPGGRTHRNR